MENLLFQTSLVAAFVAGMVALFAPCCITFLLPAYLGSVFKEREKVLLMTLIFGLGIFVVLLPAVLGVALISQALFRYHDLIYLFGGWLMVIMSFITLLGLKLPMPALPQTQSKTDPISIFTMGIISGITSACCAPVLIGILTLTFLSPSFFGALAVGGSYVLGMVTPLLIIALFISNKMAKFTFLRKPLFVLPIGHKSYPILLGNIIAAVIFLITGFITLTLLSTGRLSGEGMEVYTKFIQKVGFSITQIDNGLFLNLGFGFFLVLIIFLIAKKL